MTEKYVTVILNQPTKLGRCVSKKGFTTRPVLLNNRRAHPKPLQGKLSELEEQA
jgi:hypothetical protein